jgi:RNA polymerase sigma factor (sigma-70 family)
VPGSSEVSQLVQAGASGDEQAWNELVNRYTPLVMAVTRTYQLAADDAQDVSQIVWLRLVEHLPELREPEALPGWLVTTTRRECGRLVRQAWRVLPSDPHDDETLLCLSDRTPTLRQPESAELDAAILRAELRQALRDGLSELPPRDQQLLRLRAGDPPASYHEISQLLGIPVGSIGPTLRRSLEKLRGTSSMRAYLAGLASGGEGRWSA